MVRRVVTAAIAFTALMFLYALYLAAFRRFWALQKLPTDLLPPTSAPRYTDLVNTKEDIATEVAAEVFGGDAWQTRAVISLYWAEQGFFLYANEYAFPTKQSMTLAPVSVVRKRTLEGGHVEYLVLQAEKASITFDRPISLTDFSAARPVRAQASGNVVVGWNRGTPDENDDVTAYLTDLVFDRNRKLVWTSGELRVTSDTMSLNGHGGRITLRGGQDGRLEVESLQVSRQVRVEGLLSDRNRSLLVATERGGSRSKPSKGGREQYLAIECRGPLVLDAAGLQAIFHRDVVVTVQTPGLSPDVVRADELRLAFARVTEPSEGSAAAVSNRLTLKLAEAVGQPVVVSSPTRRLTASATNMAYDMTTRVLSLESPSGVQASYGALDIRVARLRLQIGSPGALQGEAPGPGELVGKGKAGADSEGIRASWQESARLELVDGRHVVTLTGNVRVEQPGRGEMVAQRSVRLWFNGSAKPTAEKSFSLPERIEATGGVVLTSDDLVLRTELLIARFTPAKRRDSDAPEKNSHEDARASPESASPSFVFCQDVERGPVIRIRAVTPAVSPADSEVPPGPADGTPPDGGEEHHRPGRRIEITAGRIRADIEAGPEKFVAREMWADEAVSIVERLSEEQSGLTIHGDNVHARGLDGSYFFEITGQPALVSTDTLTLHGKLIGLDQATQVAWVRGEGNAVFRTDVALSLDEQAGGNVQIVWSRDMFFDGLVAEFTGAVRVEQGQTVLTCERLEAHLSERIQLARRPQQAAPPILARLIATGAVELRRQSDQGITRIEGPRVVYSRQDNKIVVAGPGRFWSSGRGSPAVLRPAAPPPQDPRWKGTLVLFDRLMDVDQDKGLVRFVGRVRVWHAPIDGPDREFSHAAPPSEAMFVGCDQLELLTTKTTGVASVGETGSIQKLIARGNAKIHGQGFYAYADVLKYDTTGGEEKIIAEASETGFATFYRQTVPGRRPDVLRARKITYWPVTGEFRQEGGIMLNVRENGPLRQRTRR